MIADTDDWNTQAFIRIPQMQWGEESDEEVYFLEAVRHNAELLSPELYKKLTLECGDFTTQVTSNFFPAHIKTGLFPYHSLP